MIHFQNEVFSQPEVKYPASQDIPVWEEYVEKYGWDESDLVPEDDDNEDTEMQ